VLFDTGASHSFISQQTVNELGLKTKFVDDPIFVKNPVGGPANLCSYCKRVPISYASYRFPINLFVLEFNEFEILLGMKWLSR
ncbi:retroviral-like aspartic protease family protein, partial [Klebsiella pneumoniae]|uniref:retroviral-like aspartic protease family protein n=1 Tax=Klebsiella pneumoniae TaxID=573 RepID=UPI0013BC1B94|nr:hypothetical protein [Klebsiella pneumoniae]